MTSHSLRVAPRVAAPLDPDFRPAYLAFGAAAEVCERGSAPLALTLERPGGRCSTYRVSLPDAPDAPAFAERVLKFLLWQKGASTVLVSTPSAVADHLERLYAPGGARRFDADFMTKVYERPFAIHRVDAAAIPADREDASAVGRHLSGCRIGFDAGGSDRKVAAVVDGREVFSCEVEWDPKNQSDPDYHFAGVDDSIRRAAAHLPRIDAIGISSAGIHLDNRTRVASLFRKVPDPLFERRIKTLYLDVARQWGDVPVAVANDGDVTALAGAMSLGDQPVLGLALGTSLAAGYVDQRGHLTTWLNELAFAPIDLAEGAAIDEEWSGDRGTGVDYLSQSAVFRLAARAGIALAASEGPAVRLERMQELFARGDERARLVFESVGVYLGYAIALFAQFYRLKHVLVLGRVMSGAAGARLFEKAGEVLRVEGLATELELHLPDEATRRVGQAIAAASLPEAPARGPS